MSPMFLPVLLAVWIFSRGDAEVCLFNSSCILRCSFESGNEVVIHWVQVNGNVPVHSFYHNTDQLKRQNPRFKDRTSLFKDQISRGNASLQLTKVEVQDQGRYKCYTSTITGNKESFIDLNVEAPIHKIHIEEVEQRITCSTEMVFPKPELTWSVSPTSKVDLKHETTIQQTQGQLYNISSSLIPPENATDLAYSCTVRAGRNRRTATLSAPTAIVSADTETTIPCTSKNTPHKGLTWTFNHSETILSQSKANGPVEPPSKWKQQVKHVSESGSLTLQDLSSNQEGIYTCELSTDEEIYVSNTLLRIEKSQGTSKSAGIVGGVVVGVLVLVVAAGIAVVMLVRRKKLPCQKVKKSENSNEVRNGHQRRRSLQAFECPSNRMTDLGADESQEMQCYSEDDDIEEMYLS